MPFSRQRALAVLFLFILFSACAEVTRRDAAREALRLARGEMKAGRYHRAEAVLESLGRSRRVPPEAELLLGRCFLETKDEAAAVECFYRAEEGAQRTGQTSVEFEAARALGRMAEEAGRRRLALEHFGRAFPSAGSEGARDELSLRMSRLEWELGRRREARAYLSRVRAKTGEAYRQLSALMERKPAREIVPPKRRPEPSPVRSAPGSSRIAPRILPRSLWRAGPVLASGHPTAMTPIHRITVHHAADGDTPPTSKTRAAARLRSYQADHQGRRGWADIGYHFVIDGAGRIWEGRPLVWQGAHAGNADLNRGNIGICLMGNYDRMDVSPAQAKSLTGLLDWLTATYAIGPSDVRGHGELLKTVPGRGTACPGHNLQRFLQHWRSRRQAVVSARKTG
ncbi:MAG TPA: hypothetical protein ENK43_14940 [Planctomycetes bacterium]|nr:hypothetical protein [Planctomycetota bacterium]